MMITGILLASVGVAFSARMSPKPSKTGIMTSETCERGHRRVIRVFRDSKSNQMMRWLTHDEVGHALRSDLIPLKEPEKGASVNAKA